MENLNEEKNKFKTFGFGIIKILAYFIIYSVIGYVIETLFGLITKGVLESRKSFLYGPFCGIYGIGAVVMIMGLQKFKKNNYTLFAGGFIIGSIIEYIISFIGEWIFHIKWWDYSDMPFNVNGRICVWFSLFWGILAIYLMTHIHPKIDSLLEKIKPTTLRNITITLTILIFIDFLISSFALKMFYVRLVDRYDLDIEGVDSYIEDYRNLYDNPQVKKFVDTHFSDEKMLKAFPNIKLTKKDGNDIWVSDILTHIKPYYIKIFNKKTIQFNN